MLERRGLEHLVCECCGVVRKEYLRLLPWTVPDMHEPEQRLRCKFGFLTECATTGPTSVATLDLASISPSLRVVDNAKSV